MSFILKDQVPTRHIDVGGGNWVDVKTRMTIADRDAINAALVKIDDSAIFGAALRAKQAGNGQQAKVEGEQFTVDLSRVNAITLHRRIVAWGGPDFCVADHAESPHEEGNGACRAYPLTIENVQALDEEVAQGLLELLQGEAAGRGPLAVN